MVVTRVVVGAVRRDGDDDSARWPVPSASHGEARTFSHLKPVFRLARFNNAGLINPPYGPRFRRMLERTLRRG